MEVLLELNNLQLEVLFFGLRNFNSLSPIQTTLVLLLGQTTGTILGLLQLQSTQFPSQVANYCQDL